MHGNGGESAAGPWRVVLQLALGFAQMAGALASLHLLITRGVDTWTIAAATATTSLTVVSQMVFSRAGHGMGGEST